MVTYIPVGGGAGISGDAAEHPSMWYIRAELNTMNRDEGNLPPVWPPCPPVLLLRLVQPRPPLDRSYHTFLLLDVVPHIPATPTPFFHYLALSFHLYIYSLLTVLFIFILLHSILYSLHHPWPTWPLTLLASHPQPSHLPLPPPIYKSPCPVSHYHWWRP